MSLWNSSFSMVSLFFQPLQLARIICSHHFLKRCFLFEKVAHLSLGTRLLLDFEAVKPNPIKERWASSFLANNQKCENCRRQKFLTGHTYLTHSFILEGASAPVCAYCDRLQSLEQSVVHFSKIINQ